MQPGAGDPSTGQFKAGSRLQHKVFNIVTDTGGDFVDTGPQMEDQLGQLWQQAPAAQA
jgi:hypothetical protein